MADGPAVDADADHGFESLDPGRTVLIAGPAMTGKRRLMYRLLASVADDFAAFVTTKLDADRLAAELTDAWPERDRSVRIVDCVSRQRAVQHLSDTDDRRYVATAGDLTGIGIAVSGFMQDAYHDSDVENAVVGLHSLSTMLMYADLRRVYQFVHVVTGRVESSGFRGVFTLDTPAGDDESVTRLKGLFDGLVEVRETEATPELRARGEIDGPRTWTSF